MSEVTHEDVVGLSARVDAARDLIAGAHAPSKAHLIGDNRADDYAAPGGEWLTALVNAGSRQASEQETGKATLEALGSRYLEADPQKATLGLTGATGGFIIPNNLVSELSKAADYANPFRRLLTVRTGIGGIGVDQPYRVALPTPATIIAPGSTKENLNLSYLSYTATLYTLARIYDLSTRFVRTSAGAAEADVLSELGRAFALGESAYIVNGAGTTEPYGILTAIAAASPTYDSTFTGATTLVGSISAGIAKAAGALAVRNRKATAAMMNPADYWLAFGGQGSDTAGFYLGSPMTIDPNGNVVLWGIPIIPDNNVPSDTLLIGDFKAATLYVGMGYRVETSDQAGTRWDQNLIGFRGEEDIAFDARSAVATGAFERIVNLVP